MTPEVINKLIEIANERQRVMAAGHPLSSVYYAVHCLGIAVRYCGIN